MKTKKKIDIGAFSWKKCKSRIGNCWKSICKFLSGSFTKTRNLGTLFLVVFSVWAIWDIKTDYDPETEKLVSDLNKNFVEFFEKLQDETEPGCLYKNHQAFYHAAERDLVALQLRAGSILNNYETSKFVSILTDAHANLKSLHKLGCVKSRDIRFIEVSFSLISGSILQFELKKKPKSATSFFATLFN